MKRPESGHNTSDRIRSAARQLFIERGYDKTRMEDIASLAGVTRMMLNYHYQNKETIFRALLDQLLLDLESLLDSSSLPDGNLIETLSILLQEKMRTLIRPNAGLIRLIAIETLKGNIDQHKLLSMFIRINQSVIRYLEKVGITVNNPNNYILKSIMFQNIPLLIYSLAGDDLSQAAEIPKTDADRVFIQNFFQNLITDTTQKSSGGHS